MKKNLSRKEFLLNTSKAAVGMTAVAGVSSLLTTATTKANTKVTPWPWPYVQLDPDEVRVQAHYLYWNDKDCCSGVFGAIVNALAAKIGDPWTNLPIEVMLFGRGGGNGWGTLCGTINGGAALISLVTAKAPSGPLISELWGWYTQESLPSATANSFAANNKYLVHQFDGELAQTISGSPLCHASVSQWCFAAQKKVGDIERRERCARLAGDTAAKTVELLNAYFANTFSATFVTPDNAKACLGCHGSTALNTVMTQMDCQPCHGDPHKSTKVVPEAGGTPSQYLLKQNYPNPFNPSTKINFSLPASDKVQIVIYDVRGKLIKTLVDYEDYNAGTYSATWDGVDNFGKHAASGVYFARLYTKNYTQTIKMNLVK